MTGCRIGRIKMKSGGAEVRLIERAKGGECRNAPEALSKIIDDQSLFVGFFVMRKDRSVNCGWSYEKGVSYSDMAGAADFWKLEMQEDWKRSWGETP